MNAPLFERLFGALSRLGCSPSQSIDKFNLLLHYTYGESLSYQTKERRQRIRETWTQDVFDDFTAAKAINEAAEERAYDEFERNLRKVIANI